ncbi:ATP binding microtubule motor family protein [Trifolium repens]|nr:ATP binding microtubule motor family protein [Trifolium repens]
MSFLSAVVLKKLLDRYMQSALGGQRIVKKKTHIKKTIWEIPSKQESSYLSIILTFTETNKICKMVPVFQSFLGEFLNKRSASSPMPPIGTSGVGLT